MARVELGRADIALFSDPVGTRVEIPRLTAFTPTAVFAVARNRFEGRRFPSAVRGEGQDRTMRVDCLFDRRQHARALALQDLIEYAHGEAPDGRLQLRTHTGRVAGLDPLEVVVVTGYTPLTIAGLNRTVSFEAFRVDYAIGA